MKRMLKGLGALIMVLLFALGMIFIYIIAIILTNGYWGGKVAGYISVLIYGGLVCYKWYIPGRPIRKRNWSLIAATTLACCFMVYTLIPVADNNNPPHQKDFAGISTSYWKMKSGSTLAIYKISAQPQTIKKITPILFIHGGPGAYVRQIEIDFFRLLAKEGYDIYLYDQVGSGRSGLLAKDHYSHQRNINDLADLLDRIGAKKYILIGQSYGGALLAHAIAKGQISDRVEKAIYSEPGTSIVSKDKEMYSKHANALKGSVDVPLRVFLGWIVNPKGYFTSQNEVINFFAEHPVLIQKQFQESFPIKDSSRIPQVDLNIINYSVISILNGRVASYDPSLENDLIKHKVPSMLMLGESSYVERNAPMDLLRINPGIERVQYFRGVGHILWNGLDDHDLRVKKAILDFLDGKPSTIANYPLRTDIAEFLSSGK